MLKRTKELTVGLKFDRLMVLSFDHTDERSRRFYRCRCECGNEKVIHGSAMISGNTRSCGCLQSESAKSRRLGNDAGVINQIILQYKRHANARNLSFSIDRNNFEKIIRSECFYCGEPAGNLKKTKNYKDGLRYNGIDRVDNYRGYDLENCIPCCGQCNKAKLNMRQSDFISWIHRASKHLDTRRS